MRARQRKTGPRLFQASNAERVVHTRGAVLAGGVPVRVGAGTAEETAPPAGAQQRGVHGQTPAIASNSSHPPSRRPVEIGNRVQHPVQPFVEPGGSSTASTTRCGAARGPPSFAIARAASWFSQKRQFRGTVCKGPHQSSTAAPASRQPQEVGAAVLPMRVSTASTTELGDTVTSRFRRQRSQHPGYPRKPVRDTRPSPAAGEQDRRRRAGVVGSSIRVRAVRGPPSAPPSRGGRHNRTSATALYGTPVRSSS